MTWRQATDLGYEEKKPRKQILQERLADRVLGLLWSRALNEAEPGR